MAWIEKNKEKHAVSTVCKVLGIARSSYYQSLQQTASKRESENSAITKKIVEIHQESKQRYGAPKIQRALQHVGISISLKRVQRLMKKRGIFSITTNRWLGTAPLRSHFDRHRKNLNQ